MKQVARELGAHDQDQRHFWQRWLSPANNEMIAQLHASVYCLVLGILDDLLENTEIQLLSDRIEFDLAPMAVQIATAVDMDVDGAETAEVVVAANTQPSPHKLAIQPKAQFRTNSLALVAAGVAAGYVMHAIVANNDFRLDSILPDLRAALSNVSGSVQSLPGSVSNVAKPLAGRIMTAIGRGKGKEDDASTDGSSDPKSWFDRFRRSTGEEDAGKKEEENGGDE
jgi:hypothetical protein